MIYFFLFAYLFYLVIKYDVLGGKRHKCFHFYAIIILLILVSGFRYRLGTDTYTYINEFESYNDLSHFSMDDLYRFRYTPIWVLLNTVGKTFGSFVFVQFVVCTLHIGLLGKVLRRLCPSLLFSSFLFYYLFDYFVFNMEIMRESVAISFFLMALLAMDKGKKFLVCVYVIFAFMFHAYSLLVFVLFLLWYKVLRQRTLLSSAVVVCLAVVCIINKSLLTDLLINSVIGTDTIYTNSIIGYTLSDRYGNVDFSWKGYLVMFSLPVIYIGILFLTKKNYITCVNISRGIFESAIFFAMVLILLQYSLAIIGRMYNYFHVFTFLLIALFFRQMYMKVYGFHQRVRIYLLLMIFPLFFSYKQWIRTDNLVANLKNYSRYYPYSSVFNKEKNVNREMIYTYKDWLNK